MEIELRNNSCLHASQRRDWYPTSLMFFYLENKRILSTHICLECRQAGSTDAGSADSELTTDQRFKKVAGQREGCLAGSTCRNLPKVLHHALLVRHRRNFYSTVGPEPRRAYVWVVCLVEGVPELTPSFPLTHTAERHESSSQETEDRHRAVHIHAMAGFRRLSSGVSCRRLPATGFCRSAKLVRPRDVSGNRL